jgi:hypothetical protein
MNKQSLPESRNIMRSSDMPAHGKVQPYQPSWIDRINTWIGKLPLQTWLFHAIIGIVLILVQLLFLWLDGGLQSEELLPLIIFNSFAVPYLMALLQILDNQAVTAMNSMRPILDTSESEFEVYKYELSTMPFLKPLVSGLIIMVFTILTPLVSISPIRYAAFEQLPLFTVIYHIVDKISAFLFGVFVYHIFRQLRLANSISINHARINLFHLKPVQAFSPLTASTAIGLVFFVYPWMLMNPELFSDPVILGIILAITILVISIFVWPLWGVHKLLEEKKEGTLREIDLRFESVFLEFNQHFDDHDFKATERLNETIASLEIQYKRIKSIPTWPWRSETARFALTAIALPLVLMVIQYFVQQALGRS